MKKLSLEGFKTSLSRAEPPEDFSAQEKALWFAGKGNWEKAHLIVQDLNDPLSYNICFSPPAGRRSFKRRLLVS